MLLSLKVIQCGQVIPEYLLKKLSTILKSSFEGATNDTEEIKLHSLQNDYCFYLLQGNTIISYLTVKIKNYSTNNLKFAEIWNFCTHPNYRSQGFGTQLFGLVKSFLKETCELQFFQLLVLKNNTRAQEFYKRLGFFLVDEDLETVTMITD